MPPLGACVASDAMHVTSLELDGVALVEPRLLQDPRGSFHESWHRDRYAAHGIRAPFVQDNVSSSRLGVLRGLHLQHPSAQAKLVSVLYGEVFDVVVDVRRGSPTFGRWIGVILAARTPRQLYVPEGFAHGFVALSDEAVVSYKVTAPYTPEDELTIAWNDPAIGIEWPIAAAPLLSGRDAAAPHLAEVPPDRLPVYEGATTRMTAGA